MKKTFLISKVVLGLFAFLIMSAAHAGAPLWTFAPDAGFPPTISISPIETAIIKYTVTNQSHKSHTLQMQPIQGITSSGCTQTLGDHQSCILTLSVDGNALHGDVKNGPVLCELSSASQCYQPNLNDRLSIHLTQSPQQYTVTASGDTNVSPAPLTQQVDYNQTGSINLTVTAGYTAAIASDTCGGSLVGTTYTTGPVTSACSVSFTSTLNHYTVTASGDTNVAPNPLSQQVNYNQTGTVDLTVTAGYTAAIASDTCGGSLVGTTYTTGPVTSACSVSFTSTLNHYTVTASGDTNVAPNPLSQQVNYNQTGSINLTVTAGYTAAIASDTCGGSLVGTTYTTGPVTSACSVSFTSTLNHYTVTASGDTNVAPNPLSQQVNYNQTGTVDLTVTAGYTAAIASDTCGGSLVGTTYTTGPVTSACSVSFTSTLNHYTVTASGDTNVAPNPLSQQVNYNQTGTVDLTVTAGYTAAIASDTCGGSLVGTTYTTGPVTSACSVSFTSTLNHYTVTASGDTNVAPNPLSQQVNYNQTGTVDLTVTAGYTAAIASDTCGGSLVGTTYTTGPVTSDCSVTFGSIQQFTVTPSGDGHETISPNTPQTVNTGATQAFTVTASTGYTLSLTVGGTCPAGSWAGNVYTTGAITSSCSVSFSSTINTYTVTPSGDGHEAITPDTPQTVNYGATQQFTVIPNAGYTVSILSNTCGGSLVGTTFTTAAVTSDCAVSFMGTAHQYAFIVNSTSSNTITQCLVTGSNLGSCGDSGATSLSTPTGIALNSAKTLAFITDATSNSVTQCTVNGNTLTSCADSGATNLSSPQDITLNSAGTIAFIVNGSNSVTSCNVSGGTLSSCGNAGASGLNGPTGITLNPAGSFIFIANQAGSNITRCSVSGATLSSCATALTLGVPYSLTFNAAGTIAYIPAATGIVTKCNVSGGTLSSCGDSGAPGLGNPSSVTLNAAETIAYITDQNLAVNPLKRCNIGSGGSLSGCVNSGASGLSNPTDMAFGPVPTFYFTILTDDNALAQCSISGDTLSSCTKLEALTLDKPHAITLDAAKTTAFITNDGNNTITQCNVDGGSLSACANSGATELDHPADMTLNAAGTQAFITNKGNNTITQCAVKDGTLNACINSEAKSLANPHGITLNAEGTRAFITNDGNNSVTQCSVKNSKLNSCNNTGATSLDEPYAITLNATETIAFITNHGNNTITYCNVKDGTFSGCTNSGATGLDKPYAMKLNAARTKAFITNSNKTITQCLVDGGNLSACNNMKISASNS